MAAASSSSPPPPHPITLYTHGSYTPVHTSSYAMSALPYQLRAAIHTCIHRYARSLCTGAALSPFFIGCTQGGTTASSGTNSRETLVASCEECRHYWTLAPLGIELDAPRLCTCTPSSPLVGSHCGGSWATSVHRRSTFANCMRRRLSSMWQFCAQARHFRLPCRRAPQGVTTASCGTNLRHEWWFRLLGVDILGPWHLSILGVEPPKFRLGCFGDTYLGNLQWI